MLVGVVRNEAETNDAGKEGEEDEPSLNAYRSALTTPSGPIVIDIEASTD